MTLTIGIDEAGRGALAGPVCVGAVMVPPKFDWREAFALVTKRGEVKLKDSKKLSAQQREILYEYIVAHGTLRHGAGLVDASIIDQIGIVNAVSEAAAKALELCGAKSGSVKVITDAGIRISDDWGSESFIRGDENHPPIALASIIAKVTRDRLMMQLPETFSPYQFQNHKGYGTDVHIKKIKLHGLSVIHRRSFTMNIA